MYEVPGVRVVSNFEFLRIFSRGQQSIAPSAERRRCCCCCMYNSFSSRSSPARSSAERGRQVTTAVAIKVLGLSTYAYLPIPRRISHDAAFSSYYDSSTWYLVRK